MTARAARCGAPIIEAPYGRRNQFVEPYFRRPQPDQIVVILKTREPARISVTIGKDDGRHLWYKRRWVISTTSTSRTATGPDVRPRLFLFALLDPHLSFNQHQWLTRPDGRRGSRLATSRERS